MYVYNTYIYTHVYLCTYPRLSAPPRDPVSIRAAPSPTPTLRDARTRVLQRRYCVRFYTYAQHPGKTLRIPIPFALTSPPSLSRRRRTPPAGARRGRVRAFSVRYANDTRPYRFHPSSGFVFIFHHVPFDRRVRARSDETARAAVASFQFFPDQGNSAY